MQRHPGASPKSSPSLAPQAAARSHAGGTGCGTSSYSAGQRCVWNKAKDPMGLFVLQLPLGRCAVGQDSVTSKGGIEITLLFFFFGGLTVFFARAVGEEQGCPCLLHIHLLWDVPCLQGTCMSWFILDLIYLLKAAGI